MALRSVYLSDTLLERRKIDCHASLPNNPGSRRAYQVWERMALQSHVHKQSRQPDASHEVFAGQRPIPDYRSGYSHSRSLVGICAECGRMGIWKADGSDRELRSTVAPRQ